MSSDESVGLTAAELARWQERITVVRRKQGRMLTTVILHVRGSEVPPIEALMAAAGDGSSVPAGQVVRRPDEEGRQVYWVNAVTGAAPSQ